jgi:hypothetical protein
MITLRKKIDREEFDYPALMSALSMYAKPRDKVTSLLRKGVIVRVKKGLYVYGDDYRKRPFCRELLANLIYGPSYVSLEYALSWYGLIPERVPVLTSVTPKRGRRFITPVGMFVYRRAPLTSFYLGMDRVVQDDFSFLIATPERALADKLRDDRGSSIRNQSDIKSYVFENLRLDRTLFLQMDWKMLGELAEALNSHRVALCCRLLKRMRA